MKEKKRELVFCQGEIQSDFEDHPQDKNRIIIPLEGPIQTEKIIKQNYQEEQRNQEEWKMKTTAGSFKCTKF